MKNENGGQAFPVSEDNSRGKVSGIYGGMTLRDYFAAKALTDALANQCSADASPKSIAEYFYMISDAMLAERVRE